MVVLHHVEGGIMGCMVIEINLTFVQYLKNVSCACLSELEEPHPLGDSDFLLLAFPG